MIDELKILQEILGDLTGLGGWFIAAYFTLKLATICAWVGGTYLIACQVTALFVSDMTKGEAEDIRLEAKKKIAEANAETERVQHMYKLLKEKKEAQENVTE